MKNFLIVTVTFLLAFTSTLAQDISKDWLLDTSNININSTDTKPLIIQKNTELKLNQGSFKLKDASGDYIFQNKVLVFYYDTPFEMTKSTTVTSFGG